MTTTEHACDQIEKHDNHLCQLVARSSVGEIIDLIDLPGFVCENCGRAANSDENLCRPKNLNEAKDNL